MQSDLDARGVHSTHYKFVNSGSYFANGIVLTTNESLHKILKALAPTATYHLIVDEVHRAMDDFATKGVKLRLFERAISGAAKVLYMTGTMTQVQRTMLACTVKKINAGFLRADDYCCYEFSPVKTYPLYLVQSGDFNVDLLHLLGKYKGLKERGEIIPRTVLLMDTSRMETYRQLIEKFNLLEDTEIVSRPENLDEEVEQARISNARILISSPLFSLGLNFASEPEVLWCKIAQLRIDTSQIVQTINRGNRGAVRCETRLYHGEIDSEPFKFPPDAALQERLSQIILDECEIQNATFELPQMIDRVAYLQKREIEMDSNKAMGELVSNNGFQNHVCEELQREFKITKILRDDVAEKMKEIKADARGVYISMANKFTPDYQSQPYYANFPHYSRLFEERKSNYRYEIVRVGREIEAEELAITKGITGCDYYGAKKVDVNTLRILWGQTSPWVSERFHADISQDINRVRAAKLDEVIYLLEQIARWVKEKLTLNELAGKLTQDKVFGKGYLALAKNESDFVSRRKKLDAICNKAAEMRSASKNARANFQLERLGVLVGFLNSVGIGFVKVYDRKTKSWFTDYTKPLIPAWDFDWMISNLYVLAETIKTLPATISFPFHHEEEQEKTGLLSKCQECKYFYGSQCAYGHNIDWSILGLGDKSYSEETDCGMLKPAKYSRAFPLE